MSRFKKYTMTPISSKFSEKGGYSARFVGDGYTVDARKEILPGVIKDTGILIGEGAAEGTDTGFDKSHRIESPFDLHTQ